MLNSRSCQTLPSAVFSSCAASTSPSPCCTARLIDSAIRSRTPSRTTTRSITASMLCVFWATSARRIVHVDHLAVDPGAEEARPCGSISKHVLVLALSPADQRRQDHHPRAGAQLQQGVEDLLGRLLADRLAALIASRLAQPGEQQPQVIVDFGDRGHGAAGIVAARPLVDRDRRLKALDQVDVGPFQLVEELPGVGREAFDVLPLAFGVERVEGQRTLARAAGAGDDHEPVAGDVEVEVLQVVHPRPADADALGRGRLDFRRHPIHVRYRREQWGIVKLSSLTRMAGGCKANQAMQSRSRLQLTLARSRMQ